jgi:hypothetical protein
VKRTGGEDRRGGEMGDEGTKREERWGEVRGGTV